MENQKSVHFNCGCKIPIINGCPKINFENLRLDCPKTWDVYKAGQTQSIFQLEKYLGKKYSKKLKPDSIPDAAALISIIRPGTLQAEDESGISLTDVYCARKNNKWESSSSIIDILLKDTYGINIYQESSMCIARDIAGFNGTQQMKLIKGIGKKIADIILQLRKEFVDGVIKLGKITEEEANHIFDNIEASARYAFNKCILGNQKLKRVCVGGNKFHPTIEELYKITTDINYAKKTGHLSLYKKHKLKKCFGFALSKCPDGRIRKNKIVNIQPAGIRQCYIITTESGKTCEVTDNHKFPTPDGDKELKELKVGDLLYICGEKGYLALTEKIVSIELGSTGMTYDIEMEAPNHNYVLDSNIVSLNSHAYSYAVTGYWTAWVKAHLPHHYICAWLRNAKNEQKPLEEIRAMISESRRLDIEVLPPSITNLPTTDFFIKDERIYFGLQSIKGCGEKGLKKLLDLNVDFSDINWLDFLVLYSSLINKTQVKNMIRSGCFDYTSKPRMECEFEYDQWLNLSKSDIKHAKDIFDIHTPYTLLDLLTLLETKVNKRRQPVVRSLIETLENPPISLQDSVDNIVDHEKELMGINVSCSRMQKANIPETNDNCADVEKKLKKSYVLVGEISEYREIKIKNGKMTGQTMASFLLEDESGQCDCVIFPKELNYYQGGMYDGNILMIEGPPSNRSNGIIVNKVYEV